MFGSAVLWRVCRRSRWTKERVFCSCAQGNKGDVPQPCEGVDTFKLWNNIVEEFTSPIAREFIQELRKGLDALGLCQLLHLFTDNDTQNFLRLISLLKADFSVDGSNQRQTEGKIYSAFIKYLREVAGGRRGDVSLCSILKFATGSEEEPVLGFHTHPSIAFDASLVPTSNTCIYKLNLSIPHGNMEVPSEDILFNLYDYAFCNAYFGLQ